MSKKRIPTGLTGRELIDLIMDMGAEDKVIMFSYNYGDHWNTTVASPVDNGELKAVEWSDYHNKFKVSQGDSEMFDPDDDLVAFVLE